MKVVILAGGFGSRLSEYTEAIPKPMVHIGTKPIIWHIMQIYAYFGHKDFYLALGYKAEVIKDFFLNCRALNSDFQVDLSSGAITSYASMIEDWKVSLIDTGLNSMTAGRLKRMQKYVGNDTFLLTYGDGLADINLDALLKFHKSHGKLVTVTAVHPAARFGELILSGNAVSDFKEKPQITHGWINGGFFVIEPKFFDFIEGDADVLEAGPLEKAARLGELMAYSHDGFWQCMDTKRDKDTLDALWNSGQAPWVKI
jgi:glucose-1-phosphate cytidylyltransferase